MVIIKKLVYKFLNNNHVLFYRKILSNRKILVFLIMVIAVTVRIWNFPDIPGGLNQDEASSGYDAWSLAHYGIDRNGTFLPSYHISWGSGASVLLSYLLIPFIWVFGLTVWTLRLPSLLISITAVWVFYLLLRRLHNEKTALLGTFFFSICPWHIMASRWALDCNLLPGMLLFSFTMTVCALQDNKAWQYAAAGALFSLSVYAYSAAAFAMPVIVIGIVIIILSQKQDGYKIKKTALFLIPLILFSIPIGCFYLVNLFDLPQIRAGIFTAPKLTTFRSVIDVPGFVDNARSLLDLIIKQNDGLPWNQIEGFGVTYRYMAPFALMGIFYLNRLQDTAIPSEAAGSEKYVPAADNHRCQWLMYIWLLSAVLVGCVINVNINRINIIWIPLIYFCVTGISVLARYFKQLLPIMTVVLGISFLSFSSAYFGEDYRNVIAGYFYEGYGEAAAYANSLGLPVADFSGVPYTNALFYSQPDPRHFHETVVYTDPNAEFRPVASFTKWYYQDAPPGSVMIKQGLAPDSQYTKQFGNYYVEHIISSRSSSSG